MDLAARARAGAQPLEHRAVAAQAPSAAETEAQAKVELVAVPGAAPRRFRAVVEAEVSTGVPAGPSVTAAAVGRASSTLGDVPELQHRSQLGQRQSRDHLHGARWPHPNHDRISARCHGRSALLLPTPGHRRNPALHSGTSTSRREAVPCRGTSLCREVASSPARPTTLAPTPSSSSVWIQPSRTRPKPSRR